MSQKMTIFIKFNNITSLVARWLIYNYWLYIFTKKLILKSEKFAFLSKARLGNCLQTILVKGKTTSIIDLADNHSSLVSLQY